MACIMTSARKTLPVFPVHARCANLHICQEANAYSDCLVLPVTIYQQNDSSDLSHRLYLVVADITGCFLFNMYTTGNFFFKNLGIFWITCEFIAIDIHSKRILKRNTQSWIWVLLSYHGGKLEANWQQSTIPAFLLCIQQLTHKYEWQADRRSYDLNKLGRMISPIKCLLKGCRTILFQISWV